MFQRSNMEKKGAVLKPGSLQEEDLAVEEQKVLAEAKEAAKSAAAGKMIKHVWKSTVVSSASAWQDLWAKSCIQYQQCNRKHWISDQKAWTPVKWKICVPRRKSQPKMQIWSWTDMAVMV